MVTLVALPDSAAPELPLGMRLLPLIVTTVPGATTFGVTFRTLGWVCLAASC